MAIEKIEGNFENNYTPKQFKQLFSLVDTNQDKMLSFDELFSSRVARAYASGGLLFIDTSEDNRYMMQILEISLITFIIIVPLTILMYCCFKRCRVDDDEYLP